MRRKQQKQLPMVVEVCLGEACRPMDSQKLVDALEALPENIRQKLDVRGMKCLGVCGRGPNVRVNGLILSDMTPERLIAVISANV